jgi:hypothetical protein
MDDLTQKHLKRFIDGRYSRNQEEFFNLFISYYNSLDESDKEYILNNSWLVLERQVYDAHKEEFNKLQFND